MFSLLLSLTLHLDLKVLLWHKFLKSWVIMKIVILLEYYSLWLQTNTFLKTNKFISLMKWHFIFYIFNGKLWKLKKYLTTTME